MNLFQVNLFCNDFPRMLRFYRDQLGFEVLPVDPGPPSTPLVNWASLSAGSVIIELFDASTLAGARVPTDGREAIELALIVDDVQEQRAVLRERGIACDEIVDEQWGRYAAFRDPEGNRLQIYEIAPAGRRERPQ